jgi:hypothetical protein
MNGSLIKIFSEEYIRKQKFDYFFVLPYFYIKELVQREKKMLKSGIKFIVPVPKPFLIFYKKNKLVKKII